MRSRAGVRRGSINVTSAEACLSAGLCSEWGGRECLELGIGGERFAGSAAGAVRERTSAIEWRPRLSAVVRYAYPLTARIQPEAAVVAFWRPDPAVFEVLGADEDYRASRWGAQLLLGCRVAFF